MELRQIRYFAAVAEELHFGRAAARLHITQPSLSHQIASLETELGLKLLQRNTRHVQLTEAGRTYFEQATLILRNVEEASRAAHQAQRGELGQLAIGLLGLAALDTMPPLLMRFRAKYPRVALSFYEHSSEDQARLILSGNLDVGIVREVKAMTAVTSRSIVNHAQALALPARHSLAKQRVVRFSDLRDEPFIMFPRSEGPGMYDRIIGACAAAGFSPRIIQEARVMTAIIGLVAAGLGVAILPPVGSRIRIGGVAYRPLSPVLKIDTGLIWDSARVASKPALKAFLECLP